MRSWAETLYRTTQINICTALKKFEPTMRFSSDSWTRHEKQKGILDNDDGGGGITNVLSKGKIFEQAGVNFSAVKGNLNSEMTEKLTGKKQELPFFATGVSLVVHPHNPHLPTTHANFRYIEVGEQAWFGGGLDLTPYYVHAEDIKHFHQSLKKCCDRFDTNYYPKFKHWCDEYFFLPHRGETRGVGGIFYDYVGKDNPQELEKFQPFVEDLCHSFIEAYCPIVERRHAYKFTQEEKDFQLLRRGRYIEFNLLYDRGTLFGLKTNGRTESILMSLPPEAKWEYNYQAKGGSREAELIQILQHPREWV